MKEPPDRVYGVDFAASKRDAGRDIWIAEGIPSDDGLEIASVAPAVDALDGEPTGRQETLAGLGEFIAKQENAAFGLDFPFGVSSDLAEPERWDEFVKRFPDSLVVDVDEAGNRPAKQLYNAVKTEVGDPKSVGIRVDVDDVGLSPTDWRMKELTFYGIREVLQPLVNGEAGEENGRDSDHVAVVPMESMESASVLVFETYPSEVFRVVDANPDGYKGHRNAHLKARLENVNALEAAGVVFTGDEENGIHEDVTGDDARARRVKTSAYDDALDAVAACYATHEAVADGVDFEQECKSFGKIFAGDTRQE